ncbi:AAA family ATPase [Psychromicrobium lacuslunae]|uniref:Shikimate kinase n=1 Tax=Psychromicrobium lacuslunae TaxID=1618207 RepID=A0A0D4BZ28_9MICC|nr:AAA family ATPase [Psychromicrobium lacuslunae]AJT41549.1 hypothetical protein UM93_08555 [Psychromicrobium lacuslunae]
MTRNGGSVAIISGPPGSGKSTISRRLSEAASPSVHLHTDDFWHFIVGGFIPPYLEESDQQNQLVLRILAKAAFGYAAGGYQVFCDGVLGPWALRPLIDNARESQLELHYLVLRPSPEVTLARATARTETGALIDPAPIRSLIEQFSSLGELEGHAIDTTGQNVEQSVAALAGLIDRRTHLLPL